jgi:hypothetical protein
MMYKVYSVRLNNDMKLGTQYKTLLECRLHTLQNLQKLLNEDKTLPDVIEIYRGSQLVRLFKPVKKGGLVYLRKLSVEAINSYVNSLEGF